MFPHKSFASHYCFHFCLSSHWSACTSLLTAAARHYLYSPDFLSSTTVLTRSTIAFSCCLLPHLTVPISYFTELHRKVLPLPDCLTLHFDHLSNASHRGFSVLSLNSIRYFHFTHSYRRAIFFTCVWHFFFEQHSFSSYHSCFVPSFTTFNCLHLITDLCIEPLLPPSHLRLLLHPRPSLSFLRPKLPISDHAPALYYKHFFTASLWHPSKIVELLLVRLLAQFPAGVPLQTFEATSHAPTHTTLGKLLLYSVLVKHRFHFLISKLAHG